VPKKNLLLLKEENAKLKYQKTALKQMPEIVVVRIRFC